MKAGSPRYRASISSSNEPGRRPAVCRQTVAGAPVSGTLESAPAFGAIDVVAGDAVARTAFVEEALLPALVAPCDDAPPVPAAACSGPNRVASALASDRTSTRV